MLMHAVALGKGGGGDGCTDTIKESALEVDGEKSPLPHGEIKPASVACQSGTLPTELHS